MIAREDPIFHPGKTGRLTTLEGHDAIGIRSLIFVPQILKGWDVAGRDVDRKGIERCGRGQWHANVFALSLVRRNLLKTSGRSRDTSWGVGSSSSRGVRSKTQCSGRSWRPPLGGAALRCLVLRWFECGHFKVLSEFGQDRLGLARTVIVLYALQNVARPRSPKGTEMVRTTAGKREGSVARMSWIGNPHPNRRHRLGTGLVVHTISPEPEATMPFRPCRGSHRPILKKHSPPALRGRDGSSRLETGLD